MPRRARRCRAVPFAALRALIWGVRVLYYYRFSLVLVLRCDAGYGVCVGWCWCLRRNLKYVFDFEKRLPSREPGAFIYLSIYLSIFLLE